MCISAYTDSTFYAPALFDESVKDTHASDVGGISVKLASNVHKDKITVLQLSVGARAMRKCRIF